MSNLDLPSPTDIGLRIPTNVDPEKYMQGFQHGLQSNKLTIDQMKTSFRMGFRAAKLYLRQNAMARGEYEPQTVQFTTRSKAPVC